MFKAKGEAGKPLATNPPFGYKKSPDDKDRWLIDEEAAGVVREIFRLCMQGHGLEHIAHKIEEKGVPLPIVYAAQKGYVNYTKLPENGYSWTYMSVSTILARREYIGDTVNFKTYRKSYKAKKKLKNAPENMMVFEGTHEPIIDRATWEAVQRIRQGKRRPTRFNEPNVFSGICFCSDCGAKMYQSRATSLDEEKWHYVCATYRKRKGECSSHQIRNVILERLVLDDLQRLTAFAREREDEFVRLVMRNSQKETVRELAASTKEYEQGIKRISELDRLITKIYEDNVAGKISDERFGKMLAGFEAEQSGLSARVAALSKIISEAKSREQDTEQFLKLVKKYTDIVELTAEILREFVEKIVVDKNPGKRGRRANTDFAAQKIQIFYNFIGALDLHEEA